MKTDRITVINTGGTFSKKYDRVKGELFVQCDGIFEKLKEKLLISPSVNITYERMICKDSLYITYEERKKLAEKILDVYKKENVNRFLIIHGTDTMHKTARFIDRYVENISEKENTDYNKKLVITFTGAMVPFSINESEASANFACALVNSQNAPGGIYIAMNGICGHYLNVSKDYKNGIFVLKRIPKRVLEKIDSEMDIDRLLEI